MGEYGLKAGTPEIASVGAITFGPDDVLFVADNTAATVFAIDVRDDAPEAGPEPFDLDGLDSKLAAFLGCSRGDVSVRDMDVHPRTHNVYLSVMRGKGDAAVPVLVKVDRLDGSLSEVALDGVPFSQVSIDNAPTPDDERVDVVLPDSDEGEILEIPDGRKIRIVKRPARQATVTDMAYIDGTLLVAGMSNEEFSSNLRRIPFPFQGGGVDNSLEIFHVSHGKWETAAPIRTFVPYEGGRSVLASYTCTPVVHFSLEELQSGTQAKGRTVAELGAVNSPIDMVSFTQDGGEHLLISNSAHGLIKIACSDIDTQQALTEPKQPIGVPREKEDLKGIGRLANLNGGYVLAIQKDDSGGLHLRSLKTASL
jgi:hypothetical protein